MCYIILHSFHKLQSVLSNGIKNMYILASGPELQAVGFGDAILGENLRKKKGPILDLDDLSRTLSLPSHQGDPVPGTSR